MPRNIAKPFVMTLSLIDITPLTPKYRCFYGEDVELIVSVVDEFKKPVDLSDSMVKVYYICDGEDLRQDDRITITDAEKGELRVLTSKNYLRVGTNDVRVILYDNDQEVYLQPATIICKATEITPEGGEVIYPEYNVKDEMNKTNARVSTLEDDNAINKENISVLEEVVPTKADLVDLNLERERINNIIAVEDSTDNLETADIRVDADGNIHPSAGDAVRAQVKELNKNVFPAKKDYFGNEHITVPDRLNEDFDNVHQRINKSELLEYNDTAITAEKSYYGLTKEHSIQGRTLQNVNIDTSNFYHKPLSYENGVITIQQDVEDKSFSWKPQNFLLKPNTVYTVILNVIENTISSTDTTSGTVLSITNSGLGVGEWAIRYDKTFPIKANQVGVFTSTFVLNENHGGKVGTGGFVTKKLENPSGRVRFSMCFLEGDYTNVPLSELPYVEGITSVGDLSKNLFKFGDCDFISTATSWHDTLGTPSMHTNIGDKSKNRVLLRKGDYYFNYGEKLNIGTIQLVTDTETVIRNNLGAFTLSQDTYVTVRIGVTSSATRTVLTNIQIEQGTVTTSYEPYYDGYRVSAKSCGKNLLDITYDGVYKIEDNLYGGDVSIGDTNRYFTIAEFTLEVGKTYVLGANRVIYGEPSGSGVGLIRITHKAIDGTVKYVDSTTSNPNRLIKCEVTQKVKILCYLVGNTSSTTSFRVEYSDIFISEHDNINVTYTPYVSDSKTYYLAEPLRSLPNGTKDEIVGSTLIRRVGKVVLDGSESLVHWKDIAIIQDTHMAFTLSQIHIGNNYKPSNNSNILSNNFLASTVNTSINNTPPQMFCALNQHINLSLQFKIEKSKLSTQDVNGFKAWLQANPTTVYYELATPIVTELGETLTLQTYAETTHITSDNYMLPVQKTKVPTNVQAVVSGLMVENSRLNTELSEAKNELDEKVELLNSMDSELFTSNWEMDFRLYEVEWFLEDNLQTRIKMDFNRGKTNMAMSKFEQAKVIILGGDYNRETLTRQLDAYLKRGLITQNEFETLVSMMDAKDFIVG